MKWEGGWISSLFLDDTNIKLTDKLLEGFISFQGSVAMKSLRVDSPLRERETTRELWGKEKWGRSLDSIGNWGCWEHFKKNACFVTSHVILSKGIRNLMLSLKCNRTADPFPQLSSLLHNLVRSSWVSCEIWSHTRCECRTGSGYGVSYIQGGEALPLVRLRCAHCPLHFIHASGELMWSWELRL